MQSHKKVSEHREYLRRTDPVQIIRQSREQKKNSWWVIKKTRGKRYLARWPERPFQEGERINVSHAAQKSNKIGQRINHWICDTEVMGDLDNGSVNPVMKKWDPFGVVGWGKNGGERGKKSKYRKFNCMEVIEVVVVGRECRASLKRGGMNTDWKGQD